MIGRAAVAIRRTQPNRPALDLLDFVMRARTGGLVDFGASICPFTEFGAILADAFDEDRLARDWPAISLAAPTAEDAAAMRELWKQKVLLPFAKRYSLAL